MRYAFCIRNISSDFIWRISNIKHSFRRNYSYYGRRYWKDYKIPCLMISDRTRNSWKYSIYLSETNRVMIQQISHSITQKIPPKNTNRADPSYLRMTETEKGIDIGIEKDRDKEKRQSNEKIPYPSCSILSAIIYLLKAILPALAPSYLLSAPSYLLSAPSYLLSAPSYLLSAPSYLLSAPSYLLSAPSYLL